MSNEQVCEQEGLVIDIRAPGAGAAQNESNAQADRLENLRKISNVIQALENLIVQSNGMPQFNGLVAAAGRELSLARRELMLAIHR